MISFLAAAVTAALAAGCATAPKTPAERETLRKQAEATLDVMKGQVPQLEETLQQSAGYVVFPRVGKGGVLVGGAYGRGIVYNADGEPIGFAELNQASIGAQLGGQTFSELIIFQDQFRLEQLQRGQWSLGGSASAVVLGSGAGAEIRFQDGVAVIVDPQGGLMVDLSVTGQKINFEPSA